MSEDNGAGRDDKAAPPAPRRCPICGRPEAASSRPFCSRRCANVDLGRWLKGVYKIPARDDTDTED